VRRRVDRDRRADAAIAPRFSGAGARGQGRVGLLRAITASHRGGAEARSVDVTDLPWTEVDTPEDLRRARALVASGTLESAPRA
jgi:hypothetical protein